MSSEPQLSGRRIQVIGVTGAGKSTFARRLGQELSIPVCELDSLFHESRAGGALPEDDARRSVQALVESNDEWILDGNHWVQLKDVSYNKATDIIWIDTPLPLTLWRVITRTIWEVLTIPGVLQRELSGNSLIAMSLRVRAKKHANWSKRVTTDSRWKRLSGWYGRDRFLARVRDMLRAS
ncbi:Shikimate kinase [Moelleriella libera RCEF 2490]|uniref:Shikimate kinase n=1 Tax=Moelleriella libera RCEF 2490 TaxID=1081109 RepID=A0A168EVD5_9HYPO|nr:Shikimate kinase [Moelleriella libera RCEF 2490]